MSREHDQQVIALAGIFQAASLVDQIAQRGMVAQNSFETSIASLFEMNPDMTEDIYGGVADLPYNLGLGLRTLKDVVEKKRSDNNANIMRYALSAIHLERQLHDRPDMLSTIGSRLSDLNRKAHYFGDHHTEESEPKEMQASAFTHPNVIAGLGGLYQDTLSTFSFRIQVSGDPRNLQNNENAAKIRALLLSAVRSAMLWRQVGGKRWHFIFFKSRVRPSLKRILK